MFHLASFPSSPISIIIIIIAISWLTVGGQYNNLRYAQKCVDMSRVTSQRRTYCRIRQLAIRHTAAKLPEHLRTNLNWYETFAPDRIFHPKHNYAYPPNYLRSIKIIISNIHPTKHCSIQSFLLDANKSSARNHYSTAIPFTNTREKLDARSFILAPEL